MHITETATSWVSWAGQTLVQQPYINTIYTQANQYISEAQQLIQPAPGAQEGTATQTVETQTTAPVEENQNEVEGNKQ